MEHDSNQSIICGVVNCNEYIFTHALFILLESVKIEHSIQIGTIEIKVYYNYDVIIVIVGPSLLLSVND